MKNIKQHELQDEIMREYEKMGLNPEYMMRGFSNAIKLDDGKIVIIGKPRIETKFCFDDSFDYNRAVEQAEYARTSEDYFMKENLREYDWMLECIAKREVYLYHYEMTAYKEANIYGISGHNYDSCIEPKEEDYEPLERFVREERDKFEKRLRTYLKRYGMSKVKTWTYWGQQ
jgi:hypothetical protein